MNELTKKYSYLNEVESYAGGVPTAKNVRKVLKKNFPNIKFAVRATYNRINVRWTEGPSVEQVNNEIGIFKEGSFNGMIDCYEYNESDFNRMFGGVEYVFMTRQKAA